MRRDGGLWDGVLGFCWRWGKGHWVAFGSSVIGMLGAFPVTWLEPG